MWLLIDGNNWFARDFFAAGPRCIGTFLNRLRDVQADRKPDRVAVCWDAGESFRKQISASYKAQRGEKPPGFNKSLSELRAAVDKLSPVASLSAASFEADDLIATLAAMAVDEGVKAMVFSADHDLHQILVDRLVNQVTAVTRPSAGVLNYTVVTASLLQESSGVQPHQWVDYRALTGDTSDNIKGCSGIGPQAARAILERFDSLEDFYRNPFAVTALNRRQHTLLMNYREQLPNVRRLLKLRIDAPLPASWLEAAAV